MSGTTISTSMTTGITLSMAGQNPVTILSGAGIYTASYAAIDGMSLATPWLIDNHGTLAGGSLGIFLAGFGDIVNGAAGDQSAVISGLSTGLRAAGMVANYGTIFGVMRDGVVMDGTVLNGSTADTKALISGLEFGIILSGAQANIANFGTIDVHSGTPSNAADAAIYIDQMSSAVILNGSTLDTIALIEGRYDGIIAESSVNVVNYGSITTELTLGASIYGMLLNYAGTVINRGVIDSAGGIFVYGRSAPIVVLNAGTIIGSDSFDSAVDVELEGTESGRLIVEPGSVMEGNVRFLHDSGSTTLELASGSRAGTIAGVGSQYMFFTTIDFDAGSTWVAAGNSAGLAAGEAIIGFAEHDMIVLDGFKGKSDLYFDGTGLVISNGTVNETIRILGNFDSSDFTISRHAGDTTISLDMDAACFCAGTRILTPRGEIAVEDLTTDDWVITKDGEDARIVWIGRRRVEVRRHPWPARVRPVRIAAEALADGVPSRDLDLSPDHALFLEGCLVPAKALVDGVNLRQVELAEVVYYHVELARHDVIFAERVPVETYLETGNRGAFENGGPAVTLHPDFAQAMREGQGCAPFVETGRVVEAVRGRIRARGEMRRRVSMVG